MNHTPAVAEFCHTDMTEELLVLDLVFSEKEEQQDLLFSHESWTRGRSEEERPWVHLEITKKEWQFLSDAQELNGSNSTSRDSQYPTRRFLVDSMATTPAASSNDQSKDMIQDAARAALEEQKGANTTKTKKKASQEPLDPERSMGPGMRDPRMDTSNRPCMGKHIEWISGNRFGRWTAM